MITDNQKAIFPNPEDQARMINYDVYGSALRLIADSVDNADIYSEIETRFNSIKNPLDWQGAAACLAGSFEEAVLCSAAFVYFHGGVNIVVAENFNRWQIKTDGYYAYNPKLDIATEELGVKRLFRRL